MWVRVEHMVTRQMFPERHAADIGFGDLDRFEPNPDFISVQAPQPLAGRTAVTGSVLRFGQVGVMLGACRRLALAPRACSLNWISAGSSSSSR